jgi:hypothetical protein
MDMEAIKMHLEHIEKQFNFVKNQETFVIDSKTVEFLIFAVKNLQNEYETIRKQRTWYRHRYEKSEKENNALSDGINKIYCILHDSDKELVDKLNEIEEMYRL